MPILPICHPQAQPEPPAEEGDGKPRPLLRRVQPASDAGAASDAAARAALRIWTREMGSEVAPRRGHFGPGSPLTLKFGRFLETT